MEKNNKRKGTEKYKTQNSEEENEQSSVHMHLMEDKSSTW
jgi:hypothetical protein